MSSIISLPSVSIKRPMPISNSNQSLNVDETTESTDLNIHVSWRNSAATNSTTKKPSKKPRCSNSTMSDDEESDPTYVSYNANVAGRSNNTQIKNHVKDASATFRNESRIQELSFSTSTSTPNVLTTPNFAPSIAATSTNMASNDYINNLDPTLNHSFPSLNVLLFKYIFTKL